MPPADRYLTLLRRELVRAQVRLKRAEHARDMALAENVRLRAALARARPRRSSKT
ncbi:MAG: hypothetical protein ACREEL_07540 [Stellaceae bacterium]